MNTLGNQHKFLTQRSGMTHARWRAVQHLPSEPRMFHASTKLVWMPNPLSMQDGITRPPLPFIRKDQGTYDVGRNKAKRERRERHAMYAGAWSRIQRAMGTVAAPPIPSTP